MLQSTANFYHSFIELGSCTTFKQNTIDTTTMIYLCAIIFATVTANYPYENSIKWISATNSRILQLNPTPVGVEGNIDLFLCRVHYEGNTVPGKVLIRNGTINCIVPYKAKDYTSSDFEVLVTFPEAISWKKYKGNVNKNSIPAGYMDGELSFVCRARIGNDLIPGRLEPNGRLCYVAYDGSECSVGLNIEYLGMNYLGDAMKTNILPVV